MKSWLLRRRKSNRSRCLIEGLSRERRKDSGNRAGIDLVTGNTVREEAIRLAWNGGF
jgi:hypothetical protein